MVIIHLPQGTAYLPATCLEVNSFTVFQYVFRRMSRLPNGNTMIPESTDRKLWEVNSARKRCMEFQSGSGSDKGSKISIDYSGLVGVQNTQNTVPDKFELSQIFRILSILPLILIIHFKIFGCFADCL
ncbi:MAG: hypothetical protein IPI04_15885 [Ignavibacteria bacterium]|nr:hypothetical protein [Ignavibacteria bacterium]